MLPKASDFSRALYTFDIGQNDLTSGYFLNMSTNEVRASVPDVLNQFKNVVSVSDNISHHFRSIIIINKIN